MGKMSVWLYVLIAVLVAVAANSISAVWASKATKLNWWLLAVLLISPLVFITFGLVTAKVGLAVSSATIDSLLTFSTILVGLFVFSEWSSIATIQYVGMALTLGGVLLMQFGK